METETALVWADCGIVLYTITTVDTGIAVVVYPGDTELHDALRLDETLDQARFFPLGVLVDHKLQRFKNLQNCLKKLRLVTVTALDLFIHSFQVLVLQHSDLLINMVLTGFG